MPQVVRVVPRNSLNFDDVAASSSVAVQLAPRIGISQFKDVVVSVKVLDNITIGTGAQIDILAFADASTDWELIQDISTPLATVTLDPNTSQNSVQLDKVDATNLPAMIAIWVQGTQPASQQTVQAEIEVDIIMREQ